MSSLKFSSSRFLSFIILVICLIAVADNIELINKFYWFGLTIISLGLVNFNFRFKNFDKDYTLNFKKTEFRNLVGRVGIEPTTLSLKGSCSAD